MSTSSTFSTQLLGQTEKAANAILERLLAEPGLTEPQWITLVIAAASGASLDRDRLTDRVAGALKVSLAESQARIDELVGAQLLRVSGDDRAPVQLTDAGERLQAQIRRHHADHGATVGRPAGRGPGGGRSRAEHCPGTSQRRARCPDAPDRPRRLIAQCPPPLP
jgi:hypothetical protein